VYERADAPVRAKEGLELRSGLLAGSPPPATVEITEGPLRFGVDVLDGHKTGYYLDQRDNRAVVRSLAAGTRMLDVCSYTGGFAVAAAAGDAAAVTAIDSSGPALQAAQANLERNGLEATLVEADAFAELRKRRRETFDLIVLDPPKLAASERDVPKASRAYKDLNLSAFRMLAHGGRLVTFSCSGAISEDLFQKIVFGAALDAGRTGRIVRRLSQAGDHPVALNFPESQYLKGLVVEVE
jgi:23S rRNA (cytosine1962-C5)-methyltransferase